MQEGGDVNAIYPNGMDGLNIDAVMDADGGDGGFAADAVDAGFGADGGGGY